MVPKDTIYDICQNYARDNFGLVDTLLWSKVDGFRRAKDLEALSTCTLHFNRLSHSVDDWRFLRQIEAFFKKNSLFAEKTKCSTAALASYKEAELQCEDTNRRLKGLVNRAEYSLPLDIHEQVLKAQYYISSILGPFDAFLDDLPSLVRVTPGATSTTARRNSLPQNKMRLKIWAVPRSKAYLASLYRYYGFEKWRIQTTMSNRVELVPKNWKTDRTIACEPEGQIPLQLAFDRYAKRQLRHVGIDLSDQSANMKRARHASIYDDYVTVDFKSASDTVAYNTVALLFPSDWFKYLDDVRSPYYRSDVLGTGKYAKFSSMGNGSTFTIETLVFAAACHAVGSRNFLVYGDDVIIEKKYFEQFSALTRFLGFTINEEKTFRDGPFRESCGGDYFNGVDVTPVYIRGLSQRKADLCHLVNTLRGITFPGSELGKYLQVIAEDNSLPEVPYNESTLSGVWIRPDIARRKGILRGCVRFKGGPRLSYFRAYVPVTKHVKFCDSRGYYLWFLYKNMQVVFRGPWAEPEKKIDPSQTSSVPVFQHKYVRKWVSWQPAEALPDFLYWES